jgi:hypothetical protein
MGFGEVGPLDVQLTRRDEIWGRRSGLTTRSALADLKSHSFDLFEHFMFAITAKSRGSVSFKLAAEIAGRVTAELMSKVYEQINPEALGQDFMDLSVATKYCQRLVKYSKNLKPGAIQRLVFEYPSHDFVIDLQEAKELFHRVELPTATIISFLKNRMTDLLQPRTGTNGIVEMLNLSEHAQGQTSQTPTEVKNDEQTKPIGGDGGRPEAEA